MKNKKMSFNFQSCVVLVLILFLLELSGCQLLSKKTPTEPTPKLVHTFFKMKVGSNEILIDDEPVALDAIIREIDGNTYVPLRFLVEYLGAQNLQYDAATEEISFILPKYEIPEETGETKEE